MSDKTTADIKSVGLVVQMEDEDKARQVYASQDNLKSALNMVGILEEGLQVSDDHLPIAIGEEGGTKKKEDYAKETTND